MDKIIAPALLCLLVLTGLPSAHAQTTVENSQSVGQDNNVVSYTADWFTRFRPQTALDMVRQVPGFRLENNASTRGYSNALGNLLINDRRPAAKQDQPLDILARIPAALVDRIELIRGPVREIDMQGQSSLINVILREDVPVSVQWDTYIRKTFEHGGLTPKASISLSHNWKGIDYNTGLGFRRSRVGNIGTEDIYNGTGELIEIRANQRENRNTFLDGNLNASRWFGQTFVRLNTSFDLVEHLWHQTMQREPRTSGVLSRIQTIDRDSKQPGFETGIDFERAMSDELTAKLIFLLVREYNDTVESQRVVDSGGRQTLYRVADTYNVATEAISRAELDWTGLADHTLQLNVEWAYNLLDGKFNQQDDTGNGPVFIDVPGANSRVEESRGDFMLKDIWSLGLFELDYGLGAETSTLTQTGDVDKKRDFFFVKPQTILSYTPEQGRQTRLRIAREVSQLDLEDFVSATVFEDDDLALGNPDIRPSSTWVAELGHEHHFNSDSVVKVTLFHHWITDVLDLLPLSASFEAPGNIGDGRRWGVELESTLPLAWTGLEGARLKLKARLQDSSVVDPVTGENRALSSVSNFNRLSDFFDVENHYVYSIDFRQDFRESRISWGGVFQDRADEYLYKVNELEITDDTAELNAFIETTRWFDIRIRIDLENILDFNELRDRTVYTGERGLSAIRTRELRDQQGGPRIFFTFSGGF
jgi:hypothetical protein